jgi:predicted ribosomally synthesized peptide with SipW-like signal peptide
LITLSRKGESNEMKKVLFTLVAVILCVGLMGSAFAYFTDTETSADNQFTAGNLDIELSDPTPGGDDPLNMAPGDEVTLDYTLTNNGTVYCDWEVVLTPSGDLFSGATPATAAASPDSGTSLAPSGTVDITVTISLPAEADDDYQDATGSLDVDVEATSIPTP